MFSKIKTYLINKLTFYLLQKQVFLVYFNSPQQKEIFKHIDQIKKEVSMLLSHIEAYQIVKAVKSVSKIDGDMAEVGSYQGGSAKLISIAEKNKNLYVFDTFKGLPEVGDYDGELQKGEYSSELEKVKKYLESHKNIKIVPGIFPQSAKEIINNKFSFIHLDVDTYQSTFDCLQFFYPKLHAGGIIISHDYGCGKGVTKAFDEFFQNKLEPIIELSGTQCLVIKLS